MATYEDHLGMISAVARAMGHKLCEEVAFVGGCTTALLLTDHFTRQHVRHTDDVDLIVHVINRSGWHDMVRQLRDAGFRERMDEDGPICAMYLGDMRVDFMPDDQEILGFSNRWYGDALAGASWLDLPNGHRIKLVAPAHFVATKLEAYLSRGNNDPLMSRDIEDILTLFDGRAELSGELLAAEPELRRYVSMHLAKLKEHRDFEYAVEAAANEDRSREREIHERIMLAISFGELS
ncbi:hypothetical protein [Pandoraea pulmonicola]|uniref:Uncharacterized protein conserved in bacteria n=1 Tax=Pandoraea pulmonicola TaxID=93221 RepID=A0AAJ4ZBX0_PANPU|nr:hypothetical protein [Pandoraea pulmonicola]AJC20913.1 hypothetical protein RO07_11290 [Pandoraea pulmonicola]SUA90510.1 Uncharacterized protein conserved in bacteria [Pandoraea pulmonicola]